MSEDETLLVQSGKPVGVFRTHKDAPRVLIANSNLVPKWATWEVFNELDRKGLMMYGQMTAGRWIYIGTQGIVQGTYETFVEMGRQHYGGDLKGRWILTAGLGGMGGAQPLAAVMAGAHCIAIEVQESRIEKRLETRYLDQRASSIEEALEIIRSADEPTSVGLLGNAAEMVSGNARARHPPDALTDQTSAHDPANGYCPAGWTRREVAGDARARSRAQSRKQREYRSRGTWKRCSSFKEMGIPTFDYGNNIRQEALRHGRHPRLRLPGLRARLHAAALLPRHRAVPLGRRCRAIPRTSTAPTSRVKELIPDDPHLHRWLDMARERIAFQGLPARICWVGLGQRHRLGLAFNEMVRNGEVAAPIVIGRDHLDSGSVASPNRETESMMDGSDTVSDWPLLNALLNTASARHGCRCITAAVSAWAIRSTPEW